MERQDDAEHHEDAAGADPHPAEYPRGRGYGQDYMRGGEVFGGYGYSQRPEYTRSLASRRSTEGTAPRPGDASPALPPVGAPDDVAPLTHRRQAGDAPAVAPHAPRGTQTAEGG